MPAPVRELLFLDGEWYDIQMTITHVFGYWDSFRDDIYHDDMQRLIDWLNAQRYEVNMDMEALVFDPVTHSFVNADYWWKNWGLLAPAPVGIDETDVSIATIDTFDLSEDEFDDVDAAMFLSEWREDDLILTDYESEESESDKEN